MYQGGMNLVLTYLRLNDKLNVCMFTCGFMYVVFVCSDRVEAMQLSAH